MALGRAALVAGMVVTATVGFASPALAAPGDTSVSEDDCFAGDGRVQRESDGVGTCVGGAHDGILIDDDDVSDRDRTSDRDRDRTSDRTSDRDRDRTSGTSGDDDDSDSSRERGGLRTTGDLD